MASIRRAIPRTITWAGITPWLRALLACVGIGIIALAQHAVVDGDILSKALVYGRMDSAIDAAMHSQSTLAAAVPFFIAGGVIFALNSSATEEVLRAETSSDTATRQRLLTVTVAIAVAAATALWLNWRLWRDDWARWYPIVFFGGLGLALAGFVAFDVRERPRLPRIKWSWLEVLALAALIGTLIGITVRDLGTWRYSAIGDEGVFYTIAGWIRHDPKINWLSQSAGAFGYHPAMGSAWHTLNLMIFGWDLFGWQMGALTAVVVTLPFFWWLLRELWGWRAALFGTAILASSHYLMSYSHTGYDNIFAIPPTVAALAFTVGGLNRRSTALLFLGGVFAGLGFHTFYSSRIAVAVVTAAVVLRFRRDELNLRTLAPVALGFAMTVLPLFASDGWKVIDDMQAQSIRHSGYPLREHLEGNFWRTLFAFHFSTASLHYTSGALMDPISVTLATAGFFLCLAQVRDYGSRLVLAWYVAAAVTAGLLSSYTAVSVSRLHFVLPPLAAFGGVALDRLVQAVDGVVRRRYSGVALGAATLVVIAPVLFYVNGRHFFVYSARHATTTFETVYMRELLKDRCTDAPLRDVAVMQSPDGLLDGTWYFQNRRGERPVEFEPRDLAYSYVPLPMAADSGCVGIAVQQGETRTEAAILAIEQGQGEGRAHYHVESDLSGINKILIADPERGNGVDAGGLGAVWRTDFGGADLRGIMQGAPRGAIAPIDAPVFVAPGDVPLHDFEAVAVLNVGGDVRAYPLRILAYHAVVNDVVGGVPVAVTYDPISASARAYLRADGRRALTFAATGMLRYGNAMLYDRETESWWQQMDGVATIGQLAGESLGTLPLQVAPASVVKETYPTAKMLTAPTETNIDYQRNPYLRYEYVTGRPMFQVATDDRLEPMRRVAVIGDGADRVAVPFPNAREGAGFVRRVQINGRDALLLFDWRTRSGLDSRVAANSAAAGSVTAFLADPSLDLRAGVIDFGDVSSQTRWTGLGRAVEGTGKGASLEPVAIETGFWFSVSARYPGIAIVAP